MSEENNHIKLQDNTSLSLSETSDMSEAQGTSESATQDTKGGTQPQESGDGGAWYEKPEGLGNAAGDKIQSAMAPVGNTVGKGLETAGKPLGGIIDPLVGGVMRSGEAFGDQVGVGFGNKEGGPAKQQEAEGQRMKEPVGGKEQTADNPLGL